MGNNKNRFTFFRASPSRNVKKKKKKKKNAFYISKKLFYLFYMHSHFNK